MKEGHDQPPDSGHIDNGEMSKDERIEKIQSDNGDLLSRFNDDQASSNVRRIAKEVDKDGLCEQLIML